MTNQQIPPEDIAPSFLHLRKVFISKEKGNHFACIHLQDSNNPIQAMMVIHLNKQMIPFYKQIIGDFIIDERCTIAKVKERIYEAIEATKHQN